MEESLSVQSKKLVDRLLVWLGTGKVVESALGSLDARSRRIIEARWLREKDGATLHDLAAEFKVSAERIRQIETKAMEKMRKAMGDADGVRALPAPA